MNTVNESGLQAGRYLYRTHEVRGGKIGVDGNSLRIDGSSGGGKCPASPVCMKDTDSIHNSGPRLTTASAISPLATGVAGVETVTEDEAAA